MKTIGVVLTFIFTVSLYAGGVFADTGCGARCCCQISPGGMHPHTDKLLKSIEDCCSNVPRVPCDLQWKKTVKLPEYTLVSSGGDYPNYVGLMEIFSDSSVNGNVIKPNSSVQPVWVKSKSPPLYLQKQSFLI